MGLALPDAATSQTQPIENVTGTWRLVDRNAESRIDHAIESVTDEMSFFIRGIAQSRIDDSVNPERRIHLAVEGDRASVGLDNWGPVALPLSGRFRRARSSDGTPLRVRAMERGGQLLLEQRAEDGGRVSYFRASGDRLQMSARIRSERLPRDITYRLQYRRVGGARLAAR